MDLGEEETAEKIAETDDFYTWLHAKARDGDRSSALCLLNTFVARAHAQMEIPRPVIEYLMYAFTDYLSDQSEGDKEALALRKYLLLAPPTGRRKGSGVKTHQKVAVVSSYWFFRKLYEMSAKDAKEIVAEMFSISVKAVEADNTEYNAIRDWSIEKLEDNSRLAAESLLKK